MSQTQIQPGGSPTPALATVSADQQTIGGAGTAQDPLVAIPAGIAPGILAQIEALLGGGAFKASDVAYYRNDFITAADVVKPAASAGGFALADGDFNGHGDVIGQLECHANGAAADVSIMCGGAVAGEFPITLGHGKFTIEWRLAVDHRPAVGADVQYTLGATDKPRPTIGTPGHGPWFACGHAMFGNGNWWCGVSGAQVDDLTAIDTGVAVDNGIAMHRFTAVYDSTLAVPSVAFSIDGAAVGTMTGVRVNALVGSVAAMYASQYNIDAINPEFFPDYVEMTYAVNRTGA